MGRYKNENIINIDSGQDKAPNILLADNDPEMSRVLLKLLAEKGFRGFVADDIETAVRQVKIRKFDIIFTCNSLEKKTGSPSVISSFNSLKEIADSSTHFVFLVEKDSPQVIELTREVMKNGCEDIFQKPVKGKELNELIDKIITAKTGINKTFGREQKIIGKSEKVTKTVKMARTVAPTSVSVLIMGESGTGKELIADLIHRKSKRKDSPFIKVNCAALSESLLESELFGHEKGAFTGADSIRKGRFELADGGTILLDEITETPLSFQAKLLRVLEQQQFERVGGQETINVNVRVISTSNKNLVEEIQQGNFRQDLYYRLGAVRIVTPPLRERTEDIEELVWYFVDRFAHEKKRNITELDPSMIEIFKNYAWPGNIRQLRNVVLTSVILGSGKTLSLADVSWLFDELEMLPQQNLNNMSDNDDNNEGLSDLGGYSLEEIERQAIFDTLQKTEGNQKQAAEFLGITDRTLRGKLKKYREEGCLQV